MQRACRKAIRWVMAASDETWLAGLALGVRGAVGSTCNYAALVYQEVLRTFEVGDLEAARQPNGSASNWSASALAIDS